MQVERYIETRRACLSDSHKADCGVYIHGNSIYDEAECIKKTLDSEILKDYPKRVFTDYCDSTLITYALIIGKRKVAICTGKAALSNSEYSHISMPSVAENALFRSIDTEKIKNLHILKCKYQDCFKVADSAAHSYERILQKAFLRDKCDKAIRRLIESKARSRSFSDVGTVCSGYSDKIGRHAEYPDDYLPCFIKDKFGLQKIFYDTLIEKVKCESKTVFVSSPREYKISALFLHGIKTAFIPYNDDTALSYEKSGRSYKVLNLSRFVDTGIIGENKSELKFLRRCEAELEQKGIEIFLEFSRTYENLEQSKALSPVEESEKLALSLAKGIHDVLTES